MDVCTCFVPVPFANTPMEFSSLSGYLSGMSVVDLLYDPHYISLESGECVHYWNPLRPVVENLSLAQLCMFLESGISSHCYFRSSAFAEFDC